MSIKEIVNPRYGGSDWLSDYIMAYIPFSFINLHRVLNSENKMNV